MPITTIICGVVLVLIGIAGYWYGLTTEHASPTALIPSAFGLVLAVLGGLAAVAAEGVRKHLMHAAMTVALIGFILTAGRLLMNVANITLSPAVMSQLAMAIVCLALVLMGIRSFAAARRNREV
jgi:hypothetical protein